MSRRITCITLLALALGLAGCTSSEPEPEGPTGPRLVIPRDHEPKVETNFTLEWSDISRDERGVLDAEEVARWVIERRNAVETCLRESPQAIGQAMQLLEEIITRVPDSSRDRFVLAQCVFSEAAYWFRFADSYAWEMNRLRVDRTAHGDEGGQPLTDEEVEAKVADLRRKFDLMLANLNERSKRALSLFLVYRQQRPDDKSVYDYLFKCHFFLQNYEEAARWLEHVLHEMDMAGTPPNEPIRQDYRLLLAEIRDQMATAQIEGGFRKVEPLVRDRLRVGEGRIGGGAGGPK